MESLLQRTRHGLLVCAGLVTAGMLLAVPLDPRTGPINAERGGSWCLVYEATSPALVFFVALVVLLAIVLSYVGRSAPRRAANQTRTSQYDAPYRKSELVPDPVLVAAPPPPAPVVGPTIALSLAAVLLVLTPLSMVALVMSHTNCERNGPRGVIFLVAAWVILIAMPSASDPRSSQS